MQSSMCYDIMSLVPSSNKQVSRVHTTTYSADGNHTQHTHNKIYNLPHHTINTLTTHNTYTLGCAPLSMGYCHQLCTNTRH